MRAQLVSEVLAEAAARYCVDPAEIFPGKRRLHSVSLARAWACRVFVETKGWSYSETGEALNMDHTSVMSAVRRIRKLEDPNA